MLSVGLYVFNLMERVEEMLLYPILHFYSCLSSSAAYSSCLSQAMGGQTGTGHKPHSAFPSPCPACPCKSPREGESLCKHTALTGDICSSRRISRSSNFCKVAEDLGEWEWQMSTLPSVSQWWPCVVLWGVPAPGRAAPAAAGRAGSTPCGHSPPGCPCRPVGKAEEKSGTSACPAFLPRAEAAQMLLAEGICLGRAQRSCAGSQHPLSLSGRLGWGK